jgi:hypothetical protein
MKNFAVMLRSRPATPEGTLMLLDERREAEEIAIELRRKGHAVEVRAVGIHGRPPSALRTLRRLHGSRTSYVTEHPAGSFSVKAQRE